MATLYGAQVWQEDANPSNIRYDVLGKDSEVIAVGDVLALSSNVLKVVAAATDVLYGVAAKAATMPATNDTVYPPFVPLNDETIFLMGTNAALTDNETDVGTYYGLTGATGAVQVNVSGGVTTTTSRQVEIVKVDPRGIGGSGAGSGLYECLVRLIKTPYSNITAT